MSDRMKILLAVSLENTKAGTHMAAATVDIDGTARVELLERLEVGWRNVTTNEKTTSIEMAQEYDDMVVTRLPEEV
jgi:hypothetical protein